MKRIAEGQLPGLLIHAVSPPRRFSPPKVTAFVDYIAAEFQLDPHVSERRNLDFDTL